MAAPVRELEHVIKEIREDRFRPDETRSGYFRSEQELEESGTESSGDEEDAAELASCLCRKRFFLHTGVVPNHRCVLRGPLRVYCCLLNEGPQGLFCMILCRGPLSGLLFIKQTRDKA